MSHSTRRDRTLLLRTGAITVADAGRHFDADHHDRRFRLGQRRKLGALSSTSAGIIAFLAVLYGWFGDAIAESEGGLYNKRIDVSYPLER